ncbi:MAG: Do family serine endopeptidase [Alphaproteobacteria bacterium]|nr:Do family serine endopeptidase [Alphaproteobacteria bacterium]
MRFFVILILIFNISFVYAAEKKLPESAQEIQLSFATTVKMAAPAVVNVYSRKLAAARRSVFDNDPFFKQFFVNRFGRNQPREQNSLGSGVIVDASGIVVTNHHVIKDADSVRVVMADSQEYEAEIILEDERSDLAVLKLVTKGETFTHIEFADSDKVEVGDLALAIGNPFGVGQTVTSGIVSAIARTNVGISDFQFFIQTDAAINPGNSGGALVDSLGRLIGVNTAIFTRSGGSNGIGFAIPANMVKRVVSSAKTGSRVLRPWIGAQIQSLNVEIALSLGLERPDGILVRAAHRDSPLYAAGIKRGDVISAMDGVLVKNEKHFRYLWGNKQIGDNITLSILRDEQKLEYDVAMLGAPEEPPKRTAIVDGNAPFTGAEIMNISPAVIEEMSLPLGSVGVIISDININSNAQAYGFKIGDIILYVGEVEIKEVADLLQVSKANQRTWRLSINRGGRIINSIVNG